MRSMTASISDRSSPDSIKVGAWLFRHRTALPVPIALAILLVPSTETSRSMREILSGVGLTVAGELIRLWAVGHIGVISRTRSDRLGPLVDTGPFAYVRNPLYLGNVLLWVGFAITAGLLWLAPAIVLVLGLEYHWIVQWEESLLTARLGERYRGYLSRVPRWIPAWSRSRATDGHGSQVRSGPGDAGPAPGHAGAGPGHAGQILFSERGTLIAIAVGYLLLWTKARF
jgi:protein-S-isoprenylcysteine O-methyltransferase Ste14